MSYARAKINRLGDKMNRPSTAAGAKVNSAPTTQKSQIPKLRSHSITNLEQSQSTPEENDIQNVDNVSSKIEENISVSELLEGVVNDAIDLIKSDDIENIESNTLLSNTTDENKSKENTETIEKIETTEKVKKVGKINKMEKVENIEKPIKVGAGEKDKKITEKKFVRNRKASACRKSSSSGIPICVSGKKSPIPSPRLQPTKKVHNSLNELSKSLEVAFSSKKKRLELLQKELFDKQQPMIDLYNSLKELKVKLEKSGKNVVLDTIKIVNYEQHNKSNVNSEVNGGGGEASYKSVVDPEFISKIKIKLLEMPTNINKNCKSLMSQQNSILNALKLHIDKEEFNQDELKNEMDNLRAQTKDLEDSLSRCITEHESGCEALVEELMNFLKNTTGIDFESKINEMKQTIKKQDCALISSTKELMNLKKELATKHDNSHVELECTKLKEKITVLEKQLEMERKKGQHDNERLKLTETSLKTLKLKSKEFENTKQLNETKINQLLQEQKNNQAKIKQMEKSYEKEISDLNKARSLDKTIIEKFTKEKSTFEIRLKTATETNEFLKQDFDERETDLKEKLAAAQNEIDIRTGELEELKKELENMQKEITDLNLQNQQNTNIIVSNTSVQPNFDNECVREQQMVILSQKAVIKSLQDKIAEITSEKLHAIKIVEKSDDEENDGGNTLKTFLSQNEQMSKYENIIKQKDAVIQQQKTDLESMQMAYYYSKAIMEKLYPPDQNGQVQDILLNGRDKLEKALAKSSADERKLARYEEEITEKRKIIQNLETMLKTREETLAEFERVNSQKRDEIESLKKYTTKVYSESLEVKKEIEMKNEIIHGMQLSHDEKTSELYKMKKELIETAKYLSTSNKKCFELQRELEFMARQLQATRDEIGQINEMQASRYESGMISDNMQQQQIGLNPWKENSESLYRRYRKEYQKDKHFRKKERMLKSYSKHVRFSDDLEAEDFNAEMRPTKLNYNQNIKLSDEPFVEGGDCTSYLEIESFGNEMLPNVINYLPSLQCTPHPKALNTKKIIRHYQAINYNVDQSLKLVNDYNSLQN